MFSFIRKPTNIFKAITVAMSLVFIQNSAIAQLSNSDQFLKAVEDREAEKATQLIDEGWVNTKQRVTGRTGLHILVDRRDTLWLRFLLQRKARPNVKDRDGVSPIMRSVELNYIEGVELLLRYKANVDYTNRSGETPLIKAVLLDRKELVGILLEAGADPDRTDNLQGLSAREYASRDPRASELLAIINKFEADKKAEAEKKNNGKNKGLDFSGVSGPTLE